MPMRCQGQPADQRGLLAGLPVPIKDLTEVKGVLTTQGSPIFATTSRPRQTSWSNISKPMAE